MQHCPGLPATRGLWLWMAQKRYAINIFVGDHIIIPLEAILPSPFEFFSCWRVLSYRIYIYIYMAENTYVKQPMPSSSATRRLVVFLAYVFSWPLRSARAS